MSRLAVGLLALLWAAGLGQQLLRPPVEGVRSSLVLGERLALAGEFCDGLYPPFRGLLRGLALWVETDPAARALIRHERLAPDAGGGLTAGYRLWLEWREEGAASTLDRLRLLAHRALWHLTGCFVAFCLLLLLSLWWAAFGSLRRADPPPPARGTEAWTLFFLWGCWNLYGLAPALGMLPLARGTPAAVLVALGLSYLWWVPSLSAHLRRTAVPQPATARVGRAYLALLVSVTLLEQLLSLLGLQPPLSAGVAEFVSRSSIPAVAVFALVVGGAVPLIEEYIFRVWLLGASREAMGDRAALLLTSLVFSLAHGSGAALPSLFLFGCLLGWVYLRSGSLLVCASIHALWNLTSLLHIVAAAP